MSLLAVETPLTPYLAQILNYLACGYEQHYDLPRPTTRACALATRA
jgi:hypothetical protein